MDNEEEFKSDIFEDKWKNRRLMTWMSFILTVFIFPLVIIVSTLTGEVEFLLNSEEMVKGLFWFSTTILMAYLGFATFEDVKEKDKEIQYKKDRWKNRRIMSWISFIETILVIPLLYIVAYFAIESEPFILLNKYVGYLIWFNISVVSFYIGLSSVDNVMKPKQ